MKKTKMRVPISQNPKEVLLLAQKIYNKHLAEATNSPLRSMQDFTWESNGPQIAAALALHESAEALKLQMEKAYRDRDLLVDKIQDSLKASRDLLTGVFRNNMKRMGDWGFLVFDQPKPRGEKEVKVA